MRRKGGFNAKSYGDAKRMERRETEKKEEKGRGREQRRQVVGGQKAEHQVGTMFGRAVHEKEYFHVPSGPEWDMRPGISKTR